MAQDRRFHALDSFRGLCALAVVVYHLHVVGSITELQFFSNADLFVEFFFVLSGFVITHAYGSGAPIDFRKFFILRTFRLLPLHVFMLGVFILFEFLKLLAAHKGFAFNKEPFTGQYAPSQILPNLFLIQAWTPLTENLSFNYPAWSISIEYYMYMIFAGVAFFCAAHKKLAWSAISLGAFVLLYNNAGALTEFAYKGLSCFFAGALSYGVFGVIKKNLKTNYVVYSLLEVVSLCLIVMALNSDLTQKTIVCSLLFCGVVTLFAFDAGVVSSLLKTRVFSFLGRLSYSIYLTHVVVLSGLILVFLVLEKRTGLTLAPMMGDVRYIDTGSGLLNNLLVALILLCVVGISYVTYTVIEVNGQKVGRYLINGRLKKIPAVINPV
ncbi:acyltransferase [Pseudomonas sp. CCI3.2]|uniref:acyltransferase family protein n=1 Tax=unclassified Pseudomonas TaxID=196821 RepID=UPI002AC9AB01|nr:MULTISPECIES: acyltransferase [unclassified Pseudomonas]MEB0079645.1 acyltransferase [Pseudomonas sp. MH10out]MEB0103435.1 acyltransferase [Pseudomonas sp. CCI3.2]MEB0122909.1 acyltransferase [Pseudomonas sp. CCI1.2]MEB0132212.1 acyltransferase [Pseudomonas sp. CCI2.4]MEB0157826.1 acyltransferase [Pseudomonas sp. AH2 (2023)]